MSIKLPGKIANMAVRTFFKKPATISYPRGDLIIADNYRGKLTYDPTDCTNCKLCMRYCPSGAIEIINEGTKEDKKMAAILTLTRCMFCCQCVDTCPRDCLSYTQNIDLSSMSKDDLVVRL